MAFTATATDPSLATTAFRVSSSLRGRMWKLEQEPAFPWTEYRHFPFCKTEKFFWSWGRWGQAWASLQWNEDLVFVRVKALRVHASVADDVAVGFGDVPSPAAHVAITGAAVHQVLWAQGNKEPSFLLHLTLQSSQRAEGPAGATVTLKEGNIYHDHRWRRLLSLVSNSPPGSGPDWPGRPSSSPHSEESRSQACPQTFHFWQVPAPPPSACSSSHWLPRPSWGTNEQENMSIRVSIMFSLHLLVWHLIVHICSAHWIK